MSDRDRKLLFGESIKSIDDVSLAKTRSFLNLKENEELLPENISENQPLQRKKSKEAWIQNYIISYNNHFKSAWDVLIMLLVIYSSITTAYVIAFDLDLPDSSPYVIFDHVMEAFFWVDLFLSFLQEYRDPQNFEYIRDFKMISLHYLKSWFIIDLLAVFPFYVFGNVKFFRLLRILRLPRFLRFLDQSRFDKLLDSVLENTSRQKKMNYLYASKYIYKVVRLILIATTLTYFLGCFWYFVVSVSADRVDTNTFFDNYTLEDYSHIRRLIICCYFALTTLATVGYGDFTPQSNVERILGILIMILGIALFSYIMGNFNDVLSNYDKQMGIVDKSSDLQTWITSLTKFTNNQPLPRDLVQKIDEHFKFFWKNDRLSSLTPDDKYLQQMPKPLKHELVRYLFDDIFSLFRGFLLINEFRDSPFYYDLAFEFLPRKYDANEYILKQGEAVHEVYLVKEGSVYIYFEYDGKKIGKYFGRGYFFGNYNIFRNLPAEFKYQSIKGAENNLITKVLAIPKSKLLKILSKYPEIFARMADNSKRNANSLRDIMKHELKHYLQQKNGKAPTMEEVERVFKECVSEKIKHESAPKTEVKKTIDSKKLKEIEPKLQVTEKAIHELMEQVGTFGKSLGTELDEVTESLQKVRDQLAMKERFVKK